MKNLSQGIGNSGRHSSEPLRSETKETSQDINTGKENVNVTKQRTSTDSIICLRFI
jgi:hypothetical protein